SRRRHTRSKRDWVQTCALPICVMLPSIERPKKLPVVLSHKEVKQLLRTPKLLKHRLVLAMLYGCGLRNFELRNVQRKDLDFDRRSEERRVGKECEIGIELADER